MGYGVFIHRSDSRYDDEPDQRYQFPSFHLSRAQQSIGDWIIYYEPTTVPNPRGYFAVAKVEKIIPDPTAQDMYLALIGQGSYLDFIDPVPFSDQGGVIERGVLNDKGRISGRAQAAVRPISDNDFARILQRGANLAAVELPRVDQEEAQPDGLLEVTDGGQAPFIFEQERIRVTALTSRPLRDRMFRHRVLRAYDKRCAVTGWQLINGRGRAEVDAAHIRPVEENGPDILTNGLALSGTVHWMFDRGLISLADDMEILISRHVNDRSSLERLINPTGKAIVPEALVEQPHPRFLQWHRTHRFKT